MTVMPSKMRQNSSAQTIGVGGAEQRALSRWCGEALIEVIL